MAPRVLEAPVASNNPPSKLCCPLVVCQGDGRILLHHADQLTQPVTHLDDSGSLPRHYAPLVLQGSCPSILKERLSGTMGILHRG